MKIMMDGIMAPERRISFLQINICGLSNHSKIAIDAYLEKHKQDVVFLNETKNKFLIRPLPIIQLLVVLQRNRQAGLRCCFVTMWRMLK